MKKITLSILLTCGFINLHADKDLYYDNKPSEIAKEDLETIKEFDTLAYNIAEKHNKEKINIGEVLRYMIRYQSHVDDYTRLTIAGTTEVGRRTARGTGTGTTDSANIFPSDFNYYRLGIEARYDFYDPKTEKDIQNQKLDYHSKLLNMIQKYANTMEDIRQLKTQLEYDRLIQIRLKMMQKTAQKYLDDRLKGINDILDTNNKLKSKAIDLEYMQEQLQDMVIDTARKGLLELLI